MERKGAAKGTLTSDWKESNVECVFEGFEAVPEEPVVNGIVSLTKAMVLEVDSNDSDELVEEHNKELSTEELEDYSLCCFKSHNSSNSSQPKSLKSLNVFYSKKVWKRVVRERGGYSKTTIF
ncbi:hypothetical protein AVEN_241812-1 [Araneus ventricosus]|uniref:Uncharacterized protein n=1 Tax=Araneus ventricosus TaxID=182803 RepID=A0A4Y2UKA1_ARAVE|nr:hypothetical protein AVEN_241812-1 [Araneus ventricosus]